MTIIFGVSGTFILLMLSVWALLPGGFGVMNFRYKHGVILQIIGTIAWFVLVLSHAYALYKLWSGITNDADTVFLWVLFPLPFHMVFFLIFARDVGTAGPGRRVHEEV